MLVLLNCKQVAELASENIDHPLTGLTWLKVKFHWMICVYCRRYNQQINLVARSMNLLEKIKEPSEDVCKSAEKFFKETHLECHPQKNPE